jgi:hypothetical protein
VCCQRQLPADLLPTYNPVTHFTGSYWQCYERMGKTDFYLAGAAAAAVSLAAAAATAAAAVAAAVAAAAAAAAVKNQLMACTEVALLDTKWLILPVLKSEQYGNIA